MANGKNLSIHQTPDSYLLNAAKNIPFEIASNHFGKSNLSIEYVAIAALWLQRLPNQQEFGKIV